MKTTALRNVTSCSLIDIYQHCKEPAVSIFRIGELNIEDSSISFFRNIGNDLPDYTTFKDTHNPMMSER
jgi:hypothetical protein